MKKLITIASSVSCMVALSGCTIDGAAMGRAGLNTLMGMGTVFVVLILISFLISGFGLVFGKSSAKKKTVAEKSMDNTIKQIEEKEDELVDDTELVAVIAAAIASYEGTSSDSFVVRSIRKSNKKNWQNAI